MFHGPQIKLRKMALRANSKKALKATYRAKMTQFHYLNNLKVNFLIQLQNQNPNFVLKFSNNEFNFENNACLRFLNLVKVARLLLLLRHFWRLLKGATIFWPA